MTKSKYTRKEYTIAQASYLAGLMDGEGTFFIGNYGNRDKNRGNGFFQTVLKVTTTDKCIAEWLFHNFGGWHSEYTPAQRAKNCKGPVYSWACTGDRLTHLCEIMLPYLIAKRDQALILLDMRKTYQSTEYVKGKQGVQSVPDYIHNRRRELMKKLQSLHCRNYSD
ncbi:MAG TPA: hypothetical protein VEL11_06055 [Candidatus Bathyarchaeia archaeon]|nr:hypothetical protein [Candidatus Bathyarchaeia archaeon]